MTRPFPTTVPEAARQLDEVSPGWEKKINKDRIIMDDPCACPLGQVFGTYSKGKMIMWGTGAPLPYNISPLFNYECNKIAWLGEINQRLLLQNSRPQPKFQLGQKVILKEDGDMPIPREITGMAIDGAGPEMEFRCGLTWYREDKITDLPTFKAEKEADFRRYMESLDT